MGFQGSHSYRPPGYFPFPEATLLPSSLQKSLLTLTMANHITQLLRKGMGEILESPFNRGEKSKHIQVVQVGRLARSHCRSHTDIIPRPPRASLTSSLCLFLLPLLVTPRPSRAAFLRGLTLASQSHCTDSKLQRLEALGSVCPSGMMQSYSCLINFRTLGIPPISVL